jgi:hypothetical protein
MRILKFHHGSLQAGGSRSHFDFGIQLRPFPPGVAGWFARAIVEKGIIDQGFGARTILQRVSKPITVVMAATTLEVVASPTPAAPPVTVRPL